MTYDEAVPCDTLATRLEELQRPPSIEKHASSIR